MKDLERLITPANAAFSPRYSREKLDAAMFVGDPLADAAVAALHERAYDRTAAKLEAVRALAAEGDRSARNFLDHVDQRPAWLDPALIAEGQKLTLAYVSLSKLSLTHSLFAGGEFARATLVTRLTGRLGANPATRIRETGGFIAAIMQPGGLEPGAIGYETTLRVRLLHSSIRAWLKRAPNFRKEFVGEPIDQTMLAMTLGLFGYLNLRSFARLGVTFSDGELAAHHHLWRYVGHLLGIEPGLLTSSLKQERELWSALVAHQAFPHLWGPGFLDESVEIAAGLAGNVERMRPFFRSLFLQLSGPGWFGVSDQPQPDYRLSALRFGHGAMAIGRRWLPGVSDSMAKRGLASFDKAVQLARVHDFGVKIEKPADAARTEAALHAVAAGVRDHFADAVASHARTH